MRVPVLPPDLVEPLVGYLVVANLVALALFAFRRAGSADGHWGGAETRTLFLAVMGGWPGAMLGRKLFPPQREIRGYGLMLDLSVLALPVVVTLPFLLRAVPGWMPASNTDRPNRIADATADAGVATGQATSAVGAALLASEVPAGARAGTPVPSALAATAPPVRPVSVASAAPTAATAVNASSTTTSSSTASGSTVTATTSGTTSTSTATTTTTATAQAPGATSTTSPSSRLRILRIRRLRRK